MAAIFFTMEMGVWQKKVQYIFYSVRPTLQFGQKKIALAMQKNPNFELPCLALTRNIPSSLVTVSAFQSVADLVRYMDEEVILHRNDIPSTFLHVYDSPTVLTKRLKVSFIGEDGLDFGGLTKEFLTVTWADVFRSYFSGEDYAIPYLPLHRSRADEKFIQIGRLLCHTVGLLHQVPPRLCRCTRLQTAFGEDKVSDEVLLPDIMLYLCQDDRALLKHAHGGFSDLSDSDQEELLNFYAVYGMQVGL